MKFPYPDLTAETSNGGRWYDTPHGAFPSITTILGFTEHADKKASLRRWQESLGMEEATKVSLAATTRGTNVHLLCERFLKGEALQQGDVIPDADVQAFNALKLKLRSVDEVWGQEVALYSKTLELAGRCDLVGIYKGVPCIIDFKTASRVKHHEDIGEYKCQLAFYGAAHDEMFGTNIEDGIILMVAGGGFPMEFKVKLVDHMDELRQRAASFWHHAINSATL